MFRFLTFSLCFVNLYEMIQQVQYFCALKSRKRAALLHSEEDLMGWLEV